MDGLNIMIVEDDYIASKRLKNYLKKIGHKVSVISTNMKDAIIDFNKHEPQLVIMDIELGEVKNAGIELTKIFNKTGAIPIIYYSGILSEKRLRNLAAETNSIAILSKSFDMDELEANIQRAMNQTPFQPISSKLDQVANILKFIYDLVRQIPGVQEKNYFWINTKNSNLNKIYFDDLYYITTEEKNVIKLYTTDTSYLYSSTLSAFLKKISHPNLFRIHSSYIININKVHEINTIDKCLILTRINKLEEIPYGEQYYKVFKSHINIIKTR